MKISLAKCVKTLKIIIYFDSVISVLWILSENMISNRERSLCVNGEKKKNGNTLKFKTRNGLSKWYWNIMAWWWRLCIMESDRPGSLLSLDFLIFRNEDNIKSWSHRGIRELNKLLYEEWEKKYTRRCLTSFLLHKNSVVVCCYNNMINKKITCTVSLPGKMRKCLCFNNIG